MSFTREDGLEIQRQNLVEWKLKLKEPIYKQLQDYVERQNKLLTDDIGYKVRRGNDLDVFIKNIKVD